MRFIPRKFHAILDYVYSVIVITSPWIFGFSQYEIATNVVYLWGLAVLLSSLNTDYEGGASKVISMAMHLRIDMAGGFFVLVSPWLFGFHSETYFFHLSAGVISILAGLLTVSCSENPHSEHADDLLNRQQH
jgi:hypothetical protein